MSNYDESIFMISSQVTSNNQSKNITSLNNESISENNNNLFEFIKELAIKYDLILPNKDIDSGNSIDSNILMERKSEFEDNKEKIDRDKLNEIFKIFSKYN